MILKIKRIGRVFNEHCSLHCCALFVMPKTCPFSTYEANLSRGFLAQNSHINPTELVPEFEQACKLHQDIGSPISRHCDPLQLGSRL